MKNPLSIEAFTDWLARQPKDGAYDVASVYDCLACRYLMAQGFTVRRMEAEPGGPSWRWLDEHHTWHKVPDAIRDVAIQAGGNYDVALSIAQRLAGPRE